MEDYIRSALFVDFDNIFLGLGRNESISFARDPRVWLDRLSNFSQLDGGEQDRERRRILLRRCYLNPTSFGNHRSVLLRAGFQVIDCPPMTGGGKNSADIYMALDILDALNHSTRFDEFIIMSGDSDFTPVLLRLRAHDRRTIVVTVGYASPIYQAAADFVIDDALFIENFLEPPEREGRRDMIIVPTPVIGDAFLARIAERISDVVSERGEVLAPDLPSIYREYQEFRASNDWLGFGTLRSLTTAVVEHRHDLILAEGEPWTVTTVVDDASAEILIPGTDESAEGVTQIKDLIAGEFLRVMADAVQAVSFPSLAHQLLELIKASGGSDWTAAGFLSFGSLIRALAPAHGFRMSRSGPGYVYDPARHVAPEQVEVDQLSSLDPTLAELIRRICNVTGAPPLSPSGYRIVFAAIANEVNASGYQLTRTARAVRDRCIEVSADISPQDRPQISRQYVNFVLQGLWHAGYRFRDNSVDPETLAELYRDNIIKLCNSAMLTLTESEKSDIESWLLIGWQE